MSKKTIIIAWRFALLQDGNCKEIIHHNSDYKVIIFKTPEDRDNLINQDCYNQLKEIIAIDDVSDLFVFIHKPQFDGRYEDQTIKMKDELLSFNNPSNNVYVEPFEGGSTHLVYDLFIDQDTNTLKDGLIDSIESIFKDLESRYGRMAILESKLNFLYACLNPNAVEQQNKFDVIVWDKDEDDVKEKASALFKDYNGKSDNKDFFEKEEYIEPLRTLRDKLLAKYD